MGFETKEFTNLGMDQDSAASKTENTFAFKNYNIRISASDDSTVLSVTNEKGPKKLQTTITGYRRRNRLTINPKNAIITSEFLTLNDITLYITIENEQSTEVKEVFLSKGKSKWNISEEVEPKLLENIKGTEIAVPEDLYFYYCTNIINYTGEDQREFRPYNMDNIVGEYVGHCVAGDNIVLFTSEINPNTDEILNYIYKISITDNFANYEILYRGNLQMDPAYPLDTLYYYESEDVQKVYWVDGVNPSRFINIKSKGNFSQLNTQFNFVPTINKAPTVRISKDYNGMGMFPSGTIQYFVSYYNKYGAETGIVFSSAIHHLSFEDRGAKADEVVTCSFNINISDVDDSFDYVKIYSAKRTSKDGPIELNVVGSYNIINGTVSAIDTNTNQETIDANTLYFIGGKLFSAETLTSKNDTLFLGNIKLLEGSISADIKDFIYENLITEQKSGIYESQIIKFTFKCFSGAELSSAYDYNIQMNYSTRMFKTFKSGETYRFAIQFLDSSNSWTSPIWIGDKVCNVTPNYDGANNQFVVPDVECTLPAGLIELVKDKYSYYRILMAETNYTNRSILAQGVVCPTMFNYEERFNNSPYAISSWFMRPRGGNASWEHLSDTNTTNDENCEIQSLSESKPPIITNTGGQALAISFHIYTYKKINITAHYVPYIENYNGDLTKLINGSKYIASEYQNKNTWKQCYEVLANFFTKLGFGIEQFLDRASFLGKCPGRTDRGDIDHSHNGALVYDGDAKSSWHIYITLTNKSIAALDVQNKRNNFYVDSSILTFHSPEITEVQDMIDNANLSFRIVGIVPITGRYSNAIINTKTTGISPSSGVVINPIINPNISHNPKTLISGTFYEDFEWNIAGSNISPGNDLFKYRIHTWHKQGSLIGQNNNAVDTNGEQFGRVLADLKDKLFVTQRFSYSTKYIKETGYGISKVSIFNSDENTLKVIDTSNGKLYYQGNYDKLIIPDEDGFLMKVNNSTGVDPSNIRQYDPVRISYKSTPHAVFALQSNYGFNILPRLGLEDAHYLPNLYSITEEELKNKQFPWSTTTVDNRWRGLGVFYCENTTESRAALEKYLVEKIHTLDDIKDDLGKFNVFALLVDSKSKIPTRSIGIMLFKYFDKKNDIIAGYFQNQPFSFMANTQYYEGIDMIHFTTKKDSESDTRIELPSSFTLSSYSIKWGSALEYKEDLIQNVDTPDFPYLYMCELYRVIPSNSLYGGNDENALEKLTWLPISDSTSINKSASKMEGDTYYQRWDCLKTYPYTEEHINKLIDITSFMVESHINLDGRCDVNRGTENLLNVRPTNFNLINSAYTQSDNLFKYNILDKKFDLNKFNNQITWSLTKSPTEDIDVWTNISLLSSLYLDGQYGKITKLLNVNDNIIAFQDKAISSILYNERIQLSTESGAPVEIQNSNKVSGYDYASNSQGATNVNNVIQTKSGVFFIDSLNKTLNKFNKEGILDVSAQGMRSYFRNNSNLNNTKLLYDNITHDVYIVDNDNCLVFNEDLNKFTSFMDYTDSKALFNKSGKSYLFNKDLYVLYEGDYGVGLNNTPMEYSIEYRINPEPYMDKTFTNAEFLADIVNVGDNINNPYSTNSDIIPFNKVEIWNDFQYGTSNLKKELMNPLAKKFKTWRIQLPRDTNSKLKHDRIRSPWVHLKLSNDAINKKMIFHNLVIKYFK